MKRVFFSAIVVLLFSLTSPTVATSEVFEVVIIDYGIYEFRAPGDVGGNKAVSKRISFVEQINLVKKTRKIPASLNTNFGFRYKIKGTPLGANIRITRVTIYPSSGLTDPNSGSAEYNYKTTFLRQIGGGKYYVGFGFDQEWELVPGTWVFQLWYEGGKLAEERFTVYAP